MSPAQPKIQPAESRRKTTRQSPPDLYQVVIECSDEAEQRDLFERLRHEGRKVRLLVL